MKHYQIRPGVILVCVSGEYMLVATRPARGFCPYIKQLNPTGAYYWSLLEAQMDPEEMIRTASERFSVDDARIRPGLLIYLESLEKEGYLLEAEA